MTSDLNVGNLVTTGQSTILTGTSSGLPTEALIENAVQANNIRADRLDIEISDNDALVGAYDELFTFTQNLQTAADALRANVGFSGLDTNVFSSRTAVLSTSTGVDAANLATFAISDDADLDGNSFTIDQVATEFIANSTSVVDSTADLALDGTFDIGLAGGTTANIAVATGDSLQDLADAINAETETTGVQASILQVSETEFQLVLEATSTNVEIEVTTTSGTDVLNSLGFTDGADNFEASQIVQDAQGGQITLNGIIITRDDNDFSGVIDGVDLTLKTADPSSLISLTVETDVTTVKNAILDVVAAYNSLREFVVANQRVGADGSVPEESVLFSDTILEQIDFIAASLIGDSFTDTSNVSTLRDLGINFDDDNFLVLEDEDALDTNLLNNFSEVEALFSSQFTTDDSQLGLIENTNTQAELDFTLSITTDTDGNITGVSGGSFTVDGTRLIGAEGTEFDGVVLSYIGGVDATINVNLRNGFADLLINQLEAYTNPDDGLIAAEQALLNSENEDLALEATEIRARGEEIREREIERYAQLEANLQAAESIIRTVRALLGIDDSDN